MRLEVHMYADVSCYCFIDNLRLTRIFDQEVYQLVEYYDKGSWHAVQNIGPTEARLICQRVAKKT